MNSTRPINKAVPGGMQCRSVWFCAFLTILLAGVFILTSRPAVDGQGQESTAGFDQADRTVLNLSDASVVRLSRATPMPAPMRAIMARGLFALPADTEASDSDSVMAKLANPLLFVLLCLVRVPWRPTAARHLSIPLYLFHQCLLC